MIGDTNLFVAVLRGVSRAVDFLHGNRELAVPFIVAAELEWGSLCSQRRLERERVAAMLQTFPIMWPDRRTVTEFAQIRYELKRRGTAISWIAALARQHGETVASADRDFAHVDGLRWLDWQIASDPSAG